MNSDRRTLSVPGRAQLAPTVTACAFVLLSGCAQTQSWLDSVRGGERPADNEEVVLGAPDAETYLDELRDLSSGDPALAAEIFADSKASAELTPNPSSTLRYAMVLATPGHPETDPQQAQRLLRELLAKPELMTQTEIAFATIYLRSAEELYVLNTEAQRLRASSDRAQRTEEAAVNQRLATVESENRRLRQELEEAEEKLDAITSIERSIRAQDQ
jgi:hypothetical protein